MKIGSRTRILGALAFLLTSLVLSIPRATEAQVAKACPWFGPGRGDPIHCWDPGQYRCPDGCTEDWVVYCDALGNGHWERVSPGCGR